MTAAHLSAPIQEFELEVLEIFNDKFSAWQFGEIDAIIVLKYFKMVLEQDSHYSLMVN